MSLHNNLTQLILWTEEKSDTPKGLYLIGQNSHWVVHSSGHELRPLSKAHPTAILVPDATSDSTLAFQHLHLQDKQAGPKSQTQFYK